MEKNVLLFVPNLIGYARVLLLGVACYNMETNPLIAAPCYFSNVLLDFFDGYAARKLNQCSKFGAILDYVTDRVSTMLLIMKLCQFYPDYILLFQMRMFLDISASWFLERSHSIHSTILKLTRDINSNESSKPSANNCHMDMGNPLLGIYYDDNVLNCTVIGNELFYVMCYLMKFSTGPLGLYTWLFWLCLPIAFVKTCFGFVKLYVGVSKMVELD